MPEHADRSSALLADVGVLAIGRPPSGLVEDRAEEIFDQAREGPFRRVADGVVREPRQRVGDRREDRSVLLAAERLDAVQERREGRLAVTDERPEVVEQREPLLRRKLRDALIQEIALDGRCEREAVEAASAGVREEPLRAVELHGLALAAKHEALLADAVRRCRIFTTIGTGQT